MEIRTRIRQLLQEYGNHDKNMEITYSKNMEIRKRIWKLLQEFGHYYKNVEIRT
jgi:uncharacterized coiled-coil DUF342 family protein